MKKKFVLCFKLAEIRLFCFASVRPKNCEIGSISNSLMNIKHGNCAVFTDQFNVDNSFLNYH